MDQLQLVEAEEPGNHFVIFVIPFCLGGVLWKQFSFMFFNRSRDRYRTRQRNSTTKTLVDIATIASTAITCIRLAYHDIVSISVAVLVMLGVVIFVAIGTNISKIVLVAAALFLFVLVYSGGNKEQFTVLMTQVGALILALMGIYIIIRGFFRR
jgi:hypothetical protein